MAEFLIGPFIVWLPKVFLGGAFIALLFLYAAGSFHKSLSVKFFKLATFAIVFFYIFYALIETAAQYYVWSRDSFGELLLPPHQNISYFLFYSFGRFWLEILLAIVGAFIFYVFLKTLSRYREGLFKDGEKELGFAAALISGWPGIVLFIPFVFASSIILSLARTTVFNARATTLGPAFLFSLIALFTWFLLSDPISFFHLTVLKI